MYKIVEENLVGKFLTKNNTIDKHRSMVYNKNMGRRCAQFKIA